ncbi:MAG: cell filamentation protein Fic, partial [Sphaerochaetaceae bacterium]|nr:cell filamentation protein Fic [Sphaerochaetaceae bacterium]
MEYSSVAQKAIEWNISERTVRYYCASGRVKDAYLEG